MTRATEVGWMPSTDEHPCPECTRQFPLRRVLYRHIDTQHEGHDQPPWRDAELVESLYRDDELSTLEIAEEFGCSSSTVTKWMDRHGIEGRSAKEAASTGEDHHHYGANPHTPDELCDEGWVREKHYL